MQIFILLSDTPAALISHARVDGQAGGMRKYLRGKVKVSALKKLFDISAAATPKPVSHTHR